MLFNNGLVCGVCVLLCCYYIVFFIVVFKEGEVMSDVWKNRFSVSQSKSKSKLYDRVPTFRPSISEWNEGLEGIRESMWRIHQKKRSGLARVIPPKEWNG